MRSPSVLANGRSRARAPVATMMCLAASSVILPSLVTVQAIEDKLRTLRPLLTKALRGNKIDDAVAMVDKVLLKDHMGLDDGQIECLRQARTMLFERRKTRARGERGED